MIDLLVRAWESPAPPVMKLLLMTLSDNAGQDGRFPSDVLEDIDKLSIRASATPTETKAALRWLEQQGVVKPAQVEQGDLINPLYCIDFERLERALS